MTGKALQYLIDLKHDEDEDHKINNYPVDYVLQK